MSLNVLIVDDCELVRSIMAKTLTLADIPLTQLYQAGNGREALGIVEEEWVDVILADLNMPIMDGIRMVDRLHDDGLLKTIPVVIVSTEGSETRIDELKRQGVTAYVRKPFTPEMIRDVIGRVLGEPDETDYRLMLSHTFCEVVEQFGLMVAEEQPHPIPICDMNGWAQAKLSFRGHRSGTLVAGAPKALARQLAANALGIDPSDALAATSAPEALRELANLLCGRIITSIAGNTAVIGLSAPSLSSIVDTDWLPLSGRTVAQFDVEGMPVAVSLTVRSCEE